LTDRGNFKAITKRINGGENGEKDREKYYRKALVTLPKEYS
jgi:predicted chitinase